MDPKTKEPLAKRSSSSDGEEKPPHQEPHRSSDHGRPDFGDEVHISGVENSQPDVSSSDDGVQSADDQAGEHHPLQTAATAGPEEDKDHGMRDHKQPQSGPVASPASAEHQIQPAGPAYKDKVRDSGRDAQHQQPVVSPGAANDAGPEYKDQVRGHRDAQQQPAVTPGVAGPAVAHKPRVRPDAGPEYKDQVRGHRDAQQLPAVAPGVAGPAVAHQLRVQPGAEAVGSDSHGGPTTTTATVSTSPPISALPVAQVEVPRTEGGDILVRAQVVTQPKLARATPMRQINRRRLALAILVLVIVVTAVVVALVTTLGRDSETDPIITGANTTTTPTSPDPKPYSLRPTAAPSEHPRHWIQLGDDIEGDSDDIGGRSIALSRTGLSLALGDPENESVSVYTYNMGRWKRLAYIEGVLLYDETGRSVALDNSGTVIAVGSPYVIPEDPFEDPDASPQRGRVRVYRINATDPKDDFEPWSNYEQIGSDIVVSEFGDEFGWSVDISDDGETVAAGSRSHCIVRVLQYSRMARDWVDFFPKIDCIRQDYDDSFGSTVRLSGDASVVAIGEPVVYGPDYNRDGNEEIGSGRVMVFHFDGTSWAQFGQTLHREVGDAFGTSLAVSNNGLILAVGAPFNDVGREQVPVKVGTKDPAVGSCRMFEYNATKERWQQLGPDINGDELFGFFGSSVSLNSDGNILAIGAVGSDKYGREAGLVRVLQFDAEMDSWVRVGQDIAGPFPGARAGKHVALSSRGDIVTIGGPHRFDSNSDDEVGTARVYETAVIFPGHFPVTVVIHADYDFYENEGWTMERLDVERQETVHIATVKDLTMKNDTNSTSVMVSEGGVYRFIIFGYLEDEAWYEVVLSADIEEGVRAVRGSGDFDDYAQHSFVAQPSLPTSSSVGSTFVTLVLDFDERPQDIHWVLLATSIVEDSESKSPMKKQWVLGFGPEQEYGSDLAGQSYTKTIDVSSVSPENMKLKFILTDSGRDGLCCENGFGSYTLYKGSSIGTADSILFSSRATRKRREVHTFSLTETGGPTLAPSTISPTGEPSHAPSSRPSSAADVVARAEAITAFINGISVADFEIAYPPAATSGNVSTEEMAVQWLIEEDPLRLTLDSPEERFRLEQRYALLTLLFQSDKDPWADPWDDDIPDHKIRDECSWYEVSCKKKDLGDGIDEIQSVVTGFSLSSRRIYSNLRIPVDISLLRFVKSFEINISGATSETRLLPSSIGNLASLSNLRTLSIAGFNGTLPSPLGQLTGLRKFEADFNSFSGPLPETLGQWKEIEYFDISQNTLNGTLPQWMGQWSNLQTFSIHNNAFTGTLPDSIGEWANLESFEIYDNLLTGSLPESIGKWRNLNTFSGYNNTLTGSLPTSIGAWTSLDRFYVNNNAFSGKLPDSIGAWTSLNRFNVSSNAFTGTLPDSIGAWTYLWDFDVNDNALIGILPDSIASWTSLDLFNVSSNAFTGMLPDSIGAWTYLLDFDVNNNALIGTLPDAIVNWTYITVARFQYNNFTGIMPSGICDHTRLTILEADCLAEIACSCCTECY